MNQASFGPLVSACITEYLHQRGNDLIARASAAQHLISAAEAQVGHGKFVRPQLIYIAWRGMGGAPAADHHAAPIVAGAAIEFFQAAALIQDDVFDASDTRRGNPATHRALESKHRAAAWLGEASHYGEVSATLVSDLCLVWSESLFNSLSLPQDHPAQSVFNSMREVVILGQYMDYLLQVDGLEVDEHAADHGFAAKFDSQALRAAIAVIESKTVSYTTISPLQIGAALAGADEKVLQECVAIGKPFGTAYQLRDDMLGVFGDPKVTGKPAGDDIREGKQTALLAIALTLASQSEVKALNRWVGASDLDDVGLDQVKEIFVTTGATEILEDRISELHQTTNCAIEASSLNQDARSALMDFAAKASQRSF